MRAVNRQFRALWEDGCRVTLFFEKGAAVRSDMADVEKLDFLRPTKIYDYVYLSIQFCLVSHPDRRLSLPLKQCSQILHFRRLSPPLTHFWFKTSGASWVTMKLAPAHEGQGGMGGAGKPPQAVRGRSDTARQLTQQADSGRRQPCGSPQTTPTV